MKVYRWDETKTHIIVVLRPDQLFDLATMDVSPPEEKEALVTAYNLISRERETYAMAYHKEWWPLDRWKRIYDQKPDRFAERDAEQLARLAAKRKDS